MIYLTPEGLEELHRRWVWYAAHDAEIHAHPVTDGVPDEGAGRVSHFTACFNRCTLLQRPDVSFLIECDRRDAPMVTALLPRLLKLVGYLLGYDGDAQAVTEGWCAEAFALVTRGV